MIVNCALERMGDYLSDTFTMLFCFTDVLQVTTVIAVIINSALKRAGDCQTYSLFLSVSEYRLQMTAMITVIVNSALKRMGDCLSDIVTVLMCSPDCAASDCGDSSDYKLCSEKERRLFLRHIDCACLVNRMCSRG